MNASANNLQHIPLDNLRLAADNVRKTAASAAENKELKASIAAAGVITPLIVRHAGEGMIYEVHAGGRRFEALQALSSEGAIPADYEVPCLVIDAGVNAREIGIIENTLRASMHPIDEFEAFNELHANGGMSVSEIALRFGKSQQDVKKRLALADLHPELRKLCRERKLSIECLQAYACTPDQELQWSTFQALKKSYGWNQPHSIRQALTRNFMNSNDALAKLVTVKAYKAAGGATSADLFQSATLLHDVALVESLAKQKLQDIADEAGEGYKWSEVDLDFRSWNNSYGTVEAQLTPEAAAEVRQLEEKAKALQDRLDALEDIDFDERTEEQVEEIDSIDLELTQLDTLIEQAESNGRHFTPEQMAQAGCIVTLDQDGKPQVIKGLVKPGDKKVKPEKSKEPDADDDDHGAAPDSDAPTYSQALAQDLAAFHLAAAKAELLDCPGLMFTVMQFVICWRMLANQPSYSLPLELSISETSFNTSKREIENLSATELAHEHRNEKLKLSWIDESIVVSFNRFQGLSQREVEDLVGYCATLALKTKSTSGLDTVNAGFLDALLIQSNALLAKHWRPTAENFFLRINQQQRLDIAAQIVPPDQLPPMVSKMKKPELSLWLEDKVKDMPPETCWMPSEFQYPF